MSYLACVVKHKTVNYYRFWNAKKAAATSMKKGVQEEARIQNALVTKEDIQTLEKSNHNIFKYLFQSSKQNFCNFGTMCIKGLVTEFQAVGRLWKSFVTKNQAFFSAIHRFSNTVYCFSHRILSVISNQKDCIMYKYNMHVVQKTQVRLLKERQKEVINKGNLSSVINPK